MNDLEGKKIKTPISLCKIIAVTDAAKKSNMAAIIMQIKLPLTLRLIIFIRHPTYLLYQNMDFIAVLLPKMKIMVAP